MSLEFNTENRNTVLAVPVRRRCSFCRNAGHNISSCNDSRLLDFQNLCLTIPIVHFREWLEAYSTQHPIIVKAYASRYCGCNTRYLHTCIDNIVIRIGQIHEELRRSSQPIQPQERFNDELDRNLYQTLSLLATLYNNVPVNETLITTIIDEYLRRYNNRRFNIKTKVVKCSSDNECECGICYDNKKIHNFIKLNCGHEFCKDCTKQLMKNCRTENPRCAFCRCEITNIELSSQEILNELKDVL